MSDQARVLLALATAPPAKSGGAAGALWFFLAYFGGPWWYLGRPGIAMLMFCLYSACVLLSFVGVGVALGLVLWVIDGISVAQQLHHHNRKREEVLRSATLATA